MSGTDLKIDSYSAFALDSNPTFYPAPNPGRALKLHGHSRGSITGGYGIEIEQLLNPPLLPPSCNWARFFTFYCASLSLTLPAANVAPTNNAIKTTALLLIFLLVYLIVYNMCISFYLYNIALLIIETYFW